MDRVRIDNEPTGSATYYMAESPHIYGERLYEIEQAGEVEISSVRMDVGKEKGKSWHDVRSAAEYHDLIWKTKGEEVFACVFDLIKTTEGADPQAGFKVTVGLDFVSKRLTLQVDPSLGEDEKKHLAEFYSMLTDENYFVNRAMDELGEELAGIKGLSRIGKAALVALIVILVAGILLSDEDPEAGPNGLTLLLCAVTLFISLADRLRQHLIKRTVKKKYDELAKRNSSYPEEN